METKICKVYISGAISNGDINERKKEFEKMENYLRACGFKPVNPFNNNIPHEAKWEVHMKKDLQMLLQCDGICMLKGWKQSKGANIEYNIAKACGIKVFIDLDEQQHTIEE